MGGQGARHPEKEEIREGGSKQRKHHKEMRLESSLERWLHLEEKGEHIADTESCLSLYCPRCIPSMGWHKGTEVSKAGRVDHSPWDTAGSGTSSICWA